MTTLPATMHSRADTRKIVNPTMYIRFRPTMSESRPMGRRSELIVRAYAIITHWTVGRSVRNSFAILGSATAMLPWSATETNRPSAMAEYTLHRYRFEV